MLQLGSKMKNAMRIQRKEGFVLTSGEQGTRREGFGGYSIGQVKMERELRAENPRGTITGRASSGESMDSYIEARNCVWRIEAE